MWVVILGATLALMSSCNSGKLTGTHNTNDTIQLYKKDTILKTGVTPAVIKCQFLQAAITAYKKEYKTLLVLENPKVLTAPQGTYGLYITDHLGGELSSSKPEFVTVLDLYSFTAPDAKQLIEIDISRQIQKILSSNQNQSSVFITLKFEPVKLSDGSFSNEAGKLSFSGVRIVQVKNN